MDRESKIEIDLWPIFWMVIISMLIVFARWGDGLPSAFELYLKAKYDLEIIDTTETQGDINV